MRALIPESATMQFSDGSTETLTRDEAVAVYLANRSTMPEKRLRIVGGRNEFERALQLHILQWLESQEQPIHPRVLIIGDSIRMRQADATGYGLHAYRHLVDDFNITHIPHNTENSGLVLHFIEDWLQDSPAIVHFNAGLHDLATVPSTDVLPPWHNTIPQYQENLRRIIAAIGNSGARKIIWGSSTPAHDGWHNVDVRTGKSRGVLRMNADVIRYNQAAAEVMGEHDIPINDLYSTVVERGLEQCLIADGIHLSAAGAELLGRAVADAIRSAWAH